MLEKCPGEKEAQIDQTHTSPPSPAKNNRGKHKDTRKIKPPFGELKGKRAVSCCFQEERMKHKQRELMHVGKGTPSSLTMPHPLLCRTVPRLCQNPPPAQHISEERPHTLFSHPTAALTPTASLF